MERASEKNKCGRRSALSKFVCTSEPTLHAQDFLAFFAYCSGVRAGSFIVLFLVGGHGKTAWRSFGRPCRFCRRQIYLIFVAAWLTGRVFSLRRENSLERVITASMRRPAWVLCRACPGSSAELFFFFFCHYYSDRGIVLGQVARLDGQTASDRRTA